jgi:NADH-quinone oxidoreductase subunit H
MSRLVSVLFAIFILVPGIFAALAFTAYAAGGLLDGVWFVGAHRLLNMLLFMLLFVMTTGALFTIADRKWGALMQDRMGPNRARLGPFRAFGVGHLVADGVKMLTKEDHRPEKASRFLYNLGPILAFAPAFALSAVLPFGPSLDIFGQRVDLVVATPDFGILYVFAIASLAVYGTALAGWASNNKFALLGGVRATSQMISYEVALGLSLVGLMMTFATVQLPAMVGESLGAGQFRYLWGNDAAMGRGGFDFGLPAWGIFLQPLGFLLFFAAAFAETKRPPFDSPEGESEIVGYFIEYSGMKFGLFMISEYVEVVILGGIITALFLGGYHLPFGELWLREQLAGNNLLLGTILATVFLLKVIVVCYVQLAVRWSFVRFRYDQIQNLGWKILLPLGIANVFVTGALVLWDPSLRLLALVGLVVIGAVLALTVSAPEPAGEEEGRAGHGALTGGGHGGAGHGRPAPAALGASTALGHDVVGAGARAPAGAGH